MTNLYNTAYPVLQFEINDYGCSECDIKINCANTNNWESLLVTIADQYGIDYVDVSFLIEKMNDIENTKKSAYFYDSKDRLVSLSIIN